MSATKYIIGTLVGSGLIWAISRLLSKKKVGDKLNTKISGAVHSMNLQGLTLRLNIELINPTEGTLTIKHPYIKVQFNGKDIASSAIQNKALDIAPFATMPLDPIYLNVPVLGLFSLGRGLWSLLMKQQAATITTITYTSIYLGGGFRSYEKTDTIPLTPKTA